MSKLEQLQKNLVDAKRDLDEAFDTMDDEACRMFTGFHREASNAYYAELNQQPRA